MIIQATFNDNDFTHILIEYLKFFKLGNFIHYLKTENMKPKEYVEMDIKADNMLKKVMYLENELTKDDKIEFKELIKQSIINFIEQKYIEDYNYLADGLKIKLIKSIEDKDMNGEVVNYFIINDAIVVQ